MPTPAPYPNTEDYGRELDEAIASIDTEPTYGLKDVLAWMRTWGTEDEVPLAQANIPPRKR